MTKKYIFNFLPFFLMLFLLPTEFYGQDNSSIYITGKLYVKMKDDLGYNVQNKQLQAQNKEDAGTLSALQELGHWKRSHKASNEKLQAMRSNAEKNLNRKLPDPSSEFYFNVYNAAHTEQAIQLLETLKDVEDVLRIPAPVKPPVPDYSPRTFYKGAGDAGINADSVRLIYGNTGEGVRLCDIEYDFDRLHVDLPEIPVIDHIPIDIFDGAGTDHGTASLGTVMAQDNGFGTTGIAPSCDAYFSSINYYDVENDDTVFSISETIYLALEVLSPGDVLMLEVQSSGPNVDGTSQKGYVAAEWFKQTYNAIVMAVGQGVIVIEPAGNGEQNLDDPIYSTGHGGHYPFLPENNSGAIMVGAGGSGAGHFGRDDYPRSILGFSNYGSRVDVQGVGEAITTCGYGDLYDDEGFNSYYTAKYAGTSSGTAVVAGAAVLVQSVFKEANGQPLTPAQMKEVLKATGKPQVDGYFPVEGYNIGPLPNTYAAARYAIEHYPLNLDGVSGTDPQLSVYPNPNNGTFTVHTPRQKFTGGEIRIVNMLGQVVEYAELNADGRNVFNTQLPLGFYTLELATRKGNTVQKIVIHE